MSDLASEPQATAFDLFRLSKAKRAVDISPNTLRTYHQDGLPFYRRGRAVYVSKRELESFITRRGKPATPSKRNGSR